LKTYYAKELISLSGEEWLEKMEEIIYEKYDCENLTNEENIFYQICYFDAQVTNGGLTQYFGNIGYTTDESHVLCKLAFKKISETIEALKEVMMIKESEILKKSFDRLVSFGRMETDDDYLKLNNDSIIKNMTSEYYELHREYQNKFEYLIKYLKPYVEKNINQFYDD